MHETLASFRKVSLSSDKWFGFTIAGVSLALAIWPWIFRHEGLRWYFVVAAAFFAVVGQTFPAWLRPLNRAWFRLGMQLNKIVNPIFMGLMFYGAVVPFGYFLRGKDFLRLKPHGLSQTYWILRDSPGPSAESLKKQF